MANAEQFAEMIDQLCATHGLVRAKYERSIVTKAPRGSKPLACFVAMPATDADLISGTDKGSAPAIYEAKDITGGIAYTIEPDLSGHHDDMLVRPELVEVGWRNRAERLGHTSEHARQWLAAYRGCEDTEYFEWLVSQEVAR